MNIFLNDWRRVKTGNKENMRFTGSRIEAFKSPVYKGRDAPNSALLLSPSHGIIPVTSITFMKKHKSSKWEVSMPTIFAKNKKIHTPST
jgi:hypothetical protein